MTARATTEKKPPKSKIAQGGKGKKQCPNCGNFVSGRAKECACGHTFEFKSASAATKRGRKSISGLEAVQAEISQIEAELSGIEEKKSRLETLKKAAELLAS